MALENVQDNITNSGDYVLRGHVHHSMKNLLPLSVTVIISGASGNIKKAVCTCKASSFDRCAHISALLLHLSDYVSTHGNTVQSPSTSKPCERNTGKKRQKTPRPVHKATYNSAKRKQSNLFDYDPRPAEFRNKTNYKLLNNFVIDMQSYAANHNETPMWLTQFKISYNDFEVDLEDTSILLSKINPNVCVQLHR